MDNIPGIEEEINQLKAKVAEASLPEGLNEKINQMLVRLSRSAGSSIYGEEYEKTTHYIQWVSKLPWNKTTEDNLDLNRAKQVLDAHHFGLEDVKDRLLEYLSVLKLNREQGNEHHITRAPILLLVGLVGTGKTTFAYSLAEAIGREIARIPFGGMGSARDLRGQSRLHLEAEPGYFIKSFSRIQSKNPIMLLDEIDRVSEDARADIMGVLVEALDPEQNHNFIDHYIDFPFDLSQTIFIGTANGTSHIATAVMDRMEPISMPSYTDEEKIKIGQDYLLPKALKETSLPENVLTIDEAVWRQIVRPLGYDAGIRTLQRTIKGIIRKVARQYVEGSIQQIQLTNENIKQYLPSFKTELT
jgi:ATP-dependent Lon protease